MNIKIIIPIYLSASFLALAQGPIEQDYSKVSITQAVKTFDDPSLKLSAPDRDAVCEKIILSKRVDLILALLGENEIQFSLAEAISKLPENDFKADIVAESLKNDGLWKEPQKVNKGTQMAMMISFCEGTLKHHLKNDPPTIGEYYNAKDRHNLAAHLQSAVKGGRLPEKRDKVNELDRQIEEGEIDEKGAVGFDEGWGEPQAGSTSNRSNDSNGSRLGVADIDSGSLPSEGQALKLDVMPAPAKEGYKLWVLIAGIVGVLAMVVVILRRR